MTSIFFLFFSGPDLFQVRYSSAAGNTYWRDEDAFAPAAPAALPDSTYIDSAHASNDHVLINSKSTNSKCEFYGATKFGVRGQGVFSCFCFFSTRRLSLVFSMHLVPLFSVSACHKHAGAGCKQHHRHWPRPGHRAFGLKGAGLLRRSQGRSRKSRTGRALMSDFSSGSSSSGIYYITM